MVPANTIAMSSNVRVVAREAGLLVALAGLTTLCAKVAIPLPWTPVPATLQVAAVIFAGAAFGSRRGFWSQALYLSLGFCGLPVFAETFAGPPVALLPTFGYLLAFPLASYLAGRWSGSRMRWAGAAMALGTIYVLGAGWLMAQASMVGANPTWNWMLLAGVVPFLPLDMLKTAVAVVSGAAIRRHAR
jgi:biotin transport system substrate-specific component